jgi:hypothetical protein
VLLRLIMHDSQRAKKIVIFVDEAADSGDQLNVPIDLCRQMSFDVCGSNFVCQNQFLGQLDHFRRFASWQFVGYL